jgi:excinuclease UvrABC nuclease subunit
MSDKEFNRNEAVAEVEKEMYEAAEKLEFERAAQLRDTLRSITGDMAPATQGPKRPSKRPDLKITYKVSDGKHGMPKGFNK